LITLSSPPPIATPACAEPNLRPRVLKLVRPIGASKYLEANHKSGIVDIKVYLSNDGSVQKALIERSSGDTFLDAATYEAATATRYAPEVRDCQAISGAYIYRTRYNTAPVPTPSPAGNARS